ncbi:M28 family peptidase [Ulvibacter litoralis]|uniref:Por secretion system C-terminal sorting domain-containing protein n=1 Tax=Ulvibacter litoralis TaxID=227084 RepID=A0A1G7I1S5_9FLAO|nr:M28 family peptidase [Ulvibacter litoralis]GHC62747.1 hypothetical protein GCM10008083_29940 [Ulvibacter litoralis]SDF06737.1 Por secretion system C-terminal sorting domain-containing protein [Ulvibacter litoralis]
MTYLARITSLILFLGTFSLSAQVFTPFYDGIVTNVSVSNIEDDLISFVDFGVKEPGTAAIDNAKDWIISRYQSLGYTDIVEQPFTVSGQITENIIVTKTGSVYPDTFLIIDGHYDTINGVGANDNGSGTVLLLELARLLKDVNTEYSIKFIHFSGEEEGLVGSEFYVANTVIPENLDIKLVFNIDEVGGVNGMTNNTIVCERDETSPNSNNTASAQATTVLANCFGLYSNLLTEISNAYGSDYVPFENNGEIITGLYEKNESPYPHTPQDIIANMDIDYVAEVTKGALGAALHFAVGIEPLSVSDVALEEALLVYPNPTNGILHIEVKNGLSENTEVTFFDTLGNKVYDTSFTAETKTIDLKFLAKGIYLARFKHNGQILTKKVVLK